MECEEFVAALLCAGAADSQRPEIRKLGFAMQEAARLAIMKRFEDDNRQLRDLRSSQAFLLILNVGLNSASRRKIEIAESSTLTMVTMLRRGGRFWGKRENLPKASELNDHGEMLEMQWKRWVKEESFKRLAYHVLFQDVQTSSALFRQPIISPAEVNLTLPCSADIWEARSAEAWRQILLNRAQTNQRLVPLQLPQYLREPDLLSRHHAIIDIQMSLRVVSSVFYSRVWQFHQLGANFALPGGKSSLVNVSSLRQQLVADSQDLFERFAKGSAVMHPCVETFLELSTMHLHVSIEDIQHLAGKEGEEQARVAAARLRSWIGRSESRQALFHAGQIARLAAQCPLEYLRGYHAIMIYQASLTMWVYALLATRHSGAQLSHRSHGQGSENGVPMIDLDGDENPALKRFILLGEGIPCIQNYSKSAESRKARQSCRIMLTDAAEVMLSMASLLASRDKTESFCIPIAGYLTKLMHSLAKASAAMKLLR
jgi:hypothetical protein